MKRNKTRRYSYINAIEELLNKYFTIYDELTTRKEGCVSPELYKKINELLVEDYNNSINNLEYMSKNAMKYLKKKRAKENSKIFWYNFKRFFHLCKKNKEIEKLIEYREKYDEEMANLFEDIISARVRESLNSPPVETSLKDEEPDFVDNPENLFDGESPELSQKSVAFDSKFSISYEESEK